MKTGGVEAGRLLERFKAACRNAGVNGESRIGRDITTTAESGGDVDERK